MYGGCITRYTVRNWPLLIIGQLFLTKPMKCHCVVRGWLRYSTCCLNNAFLFSISLCCSPHPCPDWLRCLRTKSTWSCLYFMVLFMYFLFPLSIKIMPLLWFFFCVSEPPHNLTYFAFLCKYIFSPCNLGAICCIKMQSNFATWNPSIEYVLTLLTCLRAQCDKNDKQYKQVMYNVFSV